MNLLNEKTLSALKKNWGPMSESMQCNAEVRIFDPMSCWQCYLLAINPENEQEAFMFIVSEMRSLSIGIGELETPLNRYNGEGEYMEVDDNYVPRKAAELLHVLKRRFPIE